MAQKHSPKNIAWVKDVFCPMSETFVYEPLNYFRRWKPIVITHERQNEEFFPYEEVIEFDKNKYESFFYRLKNRLFYHLPPIEIFYYETCKRHQIALVHAHFGSAGASFLLTAKKLGLPLVTNFYGYDISVMPREEYWRNAYQKLFAEGSLFIVEGPHMRDSLIQLGCPAEKVRVIHIGIDTQKYEFKPRSISGDDKIRVLMAGRFVEKKGMEYGIKAISQVVKEFPNIELRIIGDGPLKEKLVDLVSSLNLQKFVTFIGFISHNEFRKELYSAHMGLVPSVTASNGDSEGGAPKILLEMQASGLPVVATRHADIPNVVLNGKSALLADEKDIGGLAGALKTLLKNLQEWPRMGQQGSDYMSQHFSLERTVEELERIYDSVAV